MKTDIKKLSVSGRILFLFQFMFIIFFASCEKDNQQNNACVYKNPEGKYLFYSETDTSSNTIDITFFEPNRFATKGIGGNGFWFPTAPLSGKIDHCQITLDTYKNIERQGLPSPGGFPRKYYESMSGNGEYFSADDSIKLFITYERTGDFPLYFSGEIYLIKLD